MFSWLSSHVIYAEKRSGERIAWCKLCDKQMCSDALAKHGALVRILREDLTNLNNY